MDCLVAEGLSRKNENWKFVIDWAELVVGSSQMEHNALFACQEN